jgi:hypothetical protein
MTRFAAPTSLTTSQTAHTAPLTTPVAVRASALALAMVVTFSVLAGLGGTADHQFDSAVMAQGRSCSPGVALWVKPATPRA